MAAMAAAATGAAAAAAASAAEAAAPADPIISPRLGSIFSPDGGAPILGRRRRLRSSGPRRRL